MFYRWRLSIGDNDWMTDCSKYDTEWWQTVQLKSLDDIDYESGTYEPTVPNVWGRKQIEARAFTSEN